ncbi:MAG TPA: DUF4136 domain-containing protein [Chitinophagaceae bacterium]|nr:DUF4136 domain-containing protein [Chitinophagaceae bacterium]
MKKLQLKMLVGLSLILLFGWGCASTAHIEKDPSTDITAYRTFTWMNKDSKDKQQDLLDRQLKAIVTDEMEKLGFRENKNKPDMLLEYDVLVERSARTQSESMYSQPAFRQFFNPYTRRWGTIYFPSQYMGTETYQVPVNESTLTLTMVDAKNDKTIWQGWTTNIVDGKHLTSKEIRSSVKAIVKKIR